MLVSIIGNNPGLVVHKLRRDIYEFIKRIPEGRRIIKVLTITHKKIVIIVEEGIDSIAVKHMVNVLKKYGIEIEIRKETVKI